MLSLSREQTERYGCLIPGMPPPGSFPRSQEAGVLGIRAGIVGALQATEAIKWIRCPACGKDSRLVEGIDYQSQEVCAGSG